jgi:lysine-ketoglutarate reductase/saccharopine dehydrogenase-like protein (TIGR00300 family)
VHPHHSTIEAEGHLIDSGLLPAIFDKVIESGGLYEVEDFVIGRNNDEYSRLKLRVSAPTEAALAELLEDLVPLGCHPITERDATLKPAEANRVVPDDFYSTTNMRTLVRVGGAWLEVERQRMDAVVVVENGRAECRKLRDVRGGEIVVCGRDGIRVVPVFKERSRQGFAFMANEVSSERRVETAVRTTAAMLRDVKARGGRIVWVAGPVIVHTGAGPDFASLVRAGYVDAVLSGNALAVHDVEQALYGTSLGVSYETGVPVEEGHKNHMRAINTVNRAGSIAEAVHKGVVTKGVMAELVRSNVPFALAGSIRADGPLPDTAMDLVEAQTRYAELLEGADIVVMLSSMLHAIGVGNMLPAWVRTICVDINPAVVTKLSDRGSAQAIGVVTDVGLFIHLLARELTAGGSGVGSQESGSEPSLP